MRKSLLFLVFSAVVAVASTGFVGCTSLLGDFEVSNTAPPGADGGGGTTDATTCTAACGSNTCVDLTSDNANCGACGTACTNGQTCRASACMCPPDKAFCAGQCVSATRQACGASCSACQADEVCNDGCTAAPGATFETTPRDPTGWTDSAGVAIAFKLRDTGIPGTTYECRTGPEAAFTPTDPPWKPCDGATGQTPTHKPVMNPTTPEGSYRTEYRYRSDTYRSPTAAYSFYVHHSLDKVETCPRPGNAADGPHFTDQQYFLAAQTFAGGAGGAFPISDPFPMPGNVATDPFVLRNPFIKIPFVGVQTVLGMPKWPAPGAPFDHVVNERSLRHKFVLNATRTMLLVKRQYVNANPKKRDCANNFNFGSQLALLRGPDGRGPRTLDCEALVLTVHGQGVCLGRTPAGTVGPAPVPIAVDARVHSPPTFFGTLGGGTVTGTAGSAKVTVSPGVNVTFMKNRWIYLDYGNSLSRWYKVLDVAVQVLTLDKPLTFAINSRPWKYGSTNPPTPVFLIPTGFAHLYQNGKGWATAPSAGGNFNPSFGTKCETPGCNTGKPWLTYLPP